MAMPPYDPRAEQALLARVKSGDEAAFNEQVTVYSRYNDPRTGETVYRLSGIKRAEPSPDLFKVPDGVAVSDKAHGHEKVKIKVKEKASG